MNPKKVNPKQSFPKPEENSFDSWNVQKQKIHLSKKQDFYIKQREIWSVKMWQNIWFEEDWKWNDFERPVLILKKIWIMYLCLSMTTKWKDNDFYLKLEQKNENKSFLILSQPKLLDFKRFHYKIWFVPQIEFKEIQKRLKTLWF